MEVPLDKLKFAMRYPFTKTAKEIMSARAVQIDYRVMGRATKRVAGGILNETIPAMDTDDIELLGSELLSYPVARMIVSSLDVEFRNKYINGEVQRVRNYLYPTGSSESDKAEAERLAKELGVEHTGSVMSLRSYLMYIPKTLDSRLILQKVQDGNVIIDDTRFMQVVAEAARSQIEIGLPVRQEVIPPELKKDIETAVKDVEEQLKGMREMKQQRAVIAARASGIMAPCMAKIMERARSGENLPHFARVAVACYLLKAGKTVDDVVELFSHTPNFNEKTTRYQVEFIQKKGYSAPSCANMDTYGLRLPECGCLGTSRLKNPLSYGFKRSGGAGQSGGKSGGKGKGTGRSSRSSGTVVNW